MRRKSKAPSATTAASAGTPSARRTLFGLACLCVLGLAAFLGSSAPTVGAAESFPGQGFLPDNRAWEMVSPPDKNGGEVLAESSRVAVSTDGDAVTFPSFVYFGDSAGGAVATDFLAQRSSEAGTNGWSTHGIAPAADPVRLFALDRLFHTGAFAPDLSRGVYITSSALTDAPNVSTTTNLYLIGGLRGGPTTTRLLSDAQSPIYYNPFNPYLVRYQAEVAGSTSDLRHVLFESSFGLTEDAPGFTGSAPRLYENVDGRVRFVGRVPAGAATSCDDEAGPACEAASSSQAGGFEVNSFGNGDYPSHPISADGSRIFFTTSPTNKGNLYMREDGVRTVKLNVPDPGASGAGSTAATFWTASTGVDPAGSRVPIRAFFTTSQQLVAEDTNSAPDLYMWSQQAGAGGHHLTLISVDGEPADGETAYVGDVIGASEDGSYVYFTSDGQLVEGEPTYGGSILNGLYVWHDGALSYVGKLDPLSVQWNTPATRWSLDPDHRKGSRVSPDGRWLLFASLSAAGLEGRGGFAGYDHGSGCRIGSSSDRPCRELYLYSADSGRLRCASCKPSGAPAEGNAWTDRAGGAQPTWKLSHALSDDGRYVFFTSEDKLVPEDIDGVADAYEYDTRTEEIHLLSSGRDAYPSYFVGASADGHDVFFTTKERLSGWDVDNSGDLYDARVDGGMPEPTPPPPSCQGDACQPSPAQPSDPTPASAGYVGPGDAHPRRDCAAPARRAHRLGARAAGLRRRARRAARHGNRRAVLRLSRRARSVRRRAHRLGAGARRCRRANRRAGR